MSDSSGSSRTRATKLSVERLEDRTTPTFLPRIGGPGILVNGVPTTTGGLSIAAGNVLPDFLGPATAQAEVVTGSGPGVESRVEIRSQAGLLRAAFTPFPGFFGGINVAVGDVVGDGQLEIIVAVAQNGPPHVKVFTPIGQLLSSFYAFIPQFQGGLSIAAGNVTGGIRAGGFPGGTVSTNFKQELIIGTASGASHVLVTDVYGNIKSSFLAFPGANVGVNVAAANVDTMRSPGFTFTPLHTKSDTNAYDEIIVGAASGAPHVKVFRDFPSLQLIQSYYAFDPAKGVGVTVTAGSTDNRHGAEIYVSLVGTSTLRVFNGETTAFLGETTVYPSNYSRVINMAVGYFTPPNYDPSDDDTVGSNSFDFDTQDLVIVAGDGPFGQQPRYYIGLPNAPAPFNGP